MPVFISHKDKDSAHALTICQYLQSRNVSCYIDALDPETKSTDDITDLILQRMGQCSHLIAVMSLKTKDSWWVPFEIGVASEGARRISSYKIENCNLPEYLSKWPVMNSRSHLDVFIEMYKMENKTSILEKYGSFETKRSATNFHNELKRRLGQRFI